MQREGLLLDEHAWEQWLELYEPDCEYWVPMWDDDGEPTRDPQSELSLIYYQSRSGLEDRVFRIKTGKSSVKDLTAEGRAKLDELVASIKGYSAVDSIKVTGHADKMGPAALNQKLSLARARTISNYLKSKGVKAASFTTAGMGDTKPLVDCDMTQAKDALKACLAPNRRVEIEVSGTRK